VHAFDEGVGGQDQVAERRGVVAQVLCSGVEREGAQG